jgi:hypothetical protein
VQGGEHPVRCRSSLTNAGSMAGAIAGSTVLSLTEPRLCGCR